MVLNQVKRIEGGNLYGAREHPNREGEILRGHLHHQCQQAMLRNEKAPTTKLSSNILHRSNHGGDHHNQYHKDRHLLCPNIQYSRLNIHINLNI